MNKRIGMKIGRKERDDRSLHDKTVLRILVRSRAAMESACTPELRGSKHFNILFRRCFACPHSMQKLKAERSETLEAVGDTFDCKGLKSSFSTVRQILLISNSACVVLNDLKNSQQNLSITNKKLH